MFRVPEDSASLLAVGIPVQPISYDDAATLLLHMRGRTRNEFVGSLHRNVTYKAGPGWDAPRQNW